MTITREKEKKKTFYVDHVTNEEARMRRVPTLP